RIGKPAADIRARILVDQAALAGGGVDREQGAGVAPARFAQVERGAVVGEAGVAGAQAVLERDLVVLLPVVAGAAQQVDAAVGARAGGEAQPVVGVGHVLADLAGVLLDQGALAAGQVDPVQVVPLRV